MDANEKEINCPVCHKWIEGTVSKKTNKATLRRHVNWLLNSCPGGKGKKKSEIDQ